MLLAMHRQLTPLCCVLALMLGDVYDELLLQHGIVLECMIVPRLHAEVTDVQTARSTTHVEAVCARDF